MALKEQEERLKFLLSRVDSEITKFERLLKEAQAKRAELEAAVHEQGLKVVPIAVAPHSEGSSNLEEDLQQHLLDLNKLKNLISSKLTIVIKEEELIEGLKKKYGTRVGLEKVGASEFKITYSDSDSEAAFAQINNSKKMISKLRDSVEEILGTE